MATTVTQARIYRKFSILNNADRGAAIANPIGLNIIDPMASKDATLDKASRGTFFCMAVFQNVPHRSSVMPNKNAANAITNSDCGLAIEKI